MERKKIMGYPAGCALLASCMLLSSCGLLPQEEEYRAAPVVREYEAEDYTVATVTKEDVQLTKKISCVFSSAQESLLSFGISGVQIENIYVTLGDTVEAGMVLAELDMGTLTSEWSAVNNNLESSRLNREHLEERLALEERRMEAFGETESLTADSYERQIEELIQEQELLEEKLAALQEKIDARRIVAPMDGTVTYVKQNTGGTLSEKGNTIVKMVSGEECYFVADREDADMLESGDIVNVAVGSGIYETVVEVSEKSLQEGKVYLLVDTTAGQPDVGSKGSATIVLDERKDVLCVSNKAIKKIGEETVVYYEDENGIKNMKYIEIGLVGNSKTEVVSGLEFGDTVILK